MRTHFVRGQGALFSEECHVFAAKVTGLTDLGAFRYALLRQR